MEKSHSIIASKVLSILPGTKPMLSGDEGEISIETKEGIGNLVTSVDKK